MTSDSIDKEKIFWAVLSGLLLSGSFPNIGLYWLAWVALVPLLVSLSDLTVKDGFRLGFLTGMAHYLTLVYWLAYTMKTYGHLPVYLCVGILLMLSAYLALYVAVFSAAVCGLCRKPSTSFFLIPVLWVSLEYVRSFLLSGFPWELLGYSQFKALHLIQISDIFGVYGVSFVIALCNSAVFLIFLYIRGKSRQETRVTKRLAAGSILACVLILDLVWLYGKWQLQTFDEVISASPSVRVSIVQGNIDQTIKWDPAFQRITTEKYLELSLSAKQQMPDLVVWPETATPFYFLQDIRLSEMVLKGIQNTGTAFLIGSPSYIPRKDVIEYFNSAYLVGPGGKVSGRYDKVHLVPFGEYVPFKKWLPFLGKIVAEVGDFQPGAKGHTIPWGPYRVGVQICYEIIFPTLSRAMVRNDAAMLVNITNDAWFGKTGAPYQHFFMAVFRAVENRRPLIRSANTGISGFVDPAGRIIAATSLFQEAVLTRSVPVVRKVSIYTRFGDLFAMACLAVAGLALLQQWVRSARNRRD